MQFVKQHQLGGTSQSNHERSPQFPANRQLSWTPQKDECFPMLRLFPWFFSAGTNETVEAGNRPVDICCDGDLLFCVKCKSSTQVSGIHVSFPSCTMAASQGSFPKPPSFLIPQFSLHLPSLYIAGRDWVSTPARSTWMHIVISFYAFPFSCTGSFTAVCRLSRAEVSRGYKCLVSQYSSYGVQASHWSFCCRPQALECMGFSSCGTRAYLLWGMWNLPGPGIKPCISRQILTHCTTRETLLF